MCFSAEASFAAAAVLIPAGAYCVQASLRKAPRLLPLALMPLAFGVQQASEGFVWVGLDRGDPGLARQAGLVFLFFALGFWPFWLPFISLVRESRPARRLALLALTLLGTTWFWGVYLPLLTGPESLLTVRVEHHSVVYDYADVAFFQYVPARVSDALYVLAVTVPLLISSASWEGRVASLVVAASAAAAAVFFFHAFVSVWCFFAAAATVCLVQVFYRLPRPHALPH
jgi:hypothetical protein